MPAAAFERQEQCILIDASKDGMTPQSGFKFLSRKLRPNYRVEVNTDEICEETLGDALMVVFGQPMEPFEDHEVSALNEYMRHGGSVLLTACEGGDEHQRINTALKSLTAQHGIRVNEDCLISLAYFKDCLHPKEVLVKGAVMHEELQRLCCPASTKNPKVDSALPRPMSIVYPYGATLNVSRRATPILSSRDLAFPQNRTIGAISKVGTGEGGYLIVIGSSSIFDDQYLTREGNLSLLTGLIDLVENNVSLKSIDEDTPECAPKPTEVPELSLLADEPHGCLQEGGGGEGSVSMHISGMLGGSLGDSPKGDFMSLFHDTLFAYSNDLVPQISKLYEKLDVKKEQLTLIPLQFEVPLPDLVPAVFPPSLRDLPLPPLELFDLDDEFATRRNRLGQLANKCTNREDLEYFVKEAGDIVALTSREGIASANTSKPSTSAGSTEDDEKKPDMSAKEVLHALLKQLVAYRKLDQGGNATMSLGMTNGACMSPEGTARASSVITDDNTS